MTLRHAKDRRQFCSRSCATTLHEQGVRIAPRDRFWPKVDKTSTPDGCWPWTGHRLPQGYGQFSLTPTRPIKAHRFAWEGTNGPIPDSLYVCHHCDNPACCRPDHLFLGTPKDNVQDSIRKGRAYVGKTGPSRHFDRHPRGEASPNAKLTTVKVLEIRRLAGTITLTELARQHSLSVATVSAIVRRKSWKHV